MPAGCRRPTIHYIKLYFNTMGRRLGARLTLTIWRVHGRSGRTDHPGREELYVLGFFECMQTFFFCRNHAGLYGIMVLWNFWNFKEGV